MDTREQKKERVGVPAERKQTKPVYPDPKGNEQEDVRDFFNYVEKKAAAKRHNYNGNDKAL